LVTRLLPRSELSERQVNELLGQVYDDPAALRRLLVDEGTFLSAVTFSPDGRTVVAGSADRTVRAWDITDCNHPVPAATAIAGHAGAFASPGISLDGKTLPSAVRTKPSGYGISRTHPMPHQ
jgi:WD40 repeat protein